MVPGNSINYHLSTKYVGGTDSLKGKVENHHHDNFCLKYPIMSTYSGLTKYPSQKVPTCSFTNIVGEDNKEKFNYNIIFPNHFKFQHDVDDHNIPSHSKPSLEATWIFQRWSNRFFSFLLSISEVNCYLVF